MKHTSHQEFETLQVKPLFEMVFYKLSIGIGIQNWTQVQYGIFETQIDEVQNRWRALNLPEIY